MDLPWPQIITAGVSISTTALGGWIAFERRLVAHNINIENLQREIKELKEKPIKGELTEQQILANKEKTQEVELMIQEVETNLETHTNQISTIKENIEKANEDYNQFRSILDRIKDPDINLTNIEQVLEMLLQKSEAINLQNQLIELERTIESIKNLNQQEYIIKTNKFNLNKENSPDLQNYREDRDRFAEHWVDFNHTFKKPPQVFIALKMIDAATEIYSKEVRHEDLHLGNAIKFLTSLRAQFIRIDVWIKEGSITENGFTVVAKTWHDSNVLGLDIAWIAFGK